MQSQIDLDGHIDSKGIQYIGNATCQDNGKYHCLANVNGCLCIVEVSIQKYHRFYNPLGIKF